MHGKRWVNLVRCLGALLFLTLPAAPAAAEEGTVFLRGDANQDGQVSISDALMLRRYLYNGDRQPLCLEAANVNDQSIVSIGLELNDVIFLIAALFMDGPPIPEPFPTPGIDPTPTDLGCNSYSVTPPQETDDQVRVGDVQGAPGAEVWIPISITSAVPVEAFQLFLGYDPALLTFVGYSFEGTIYETLFPQGDHSPGFISVNDKPYPGVLPIGIMGSVSKVGFEVPAGVETVVIRLQAQISADAAPGTKFSLELTNGPDGTGINPPYHLKNELSHRGDARFVSVLPTLIPGRGGIVDDITVFVRGDSNGDGAVDISDPIFILSYLFLAGPASVCPDAADADDNGRIEITDAVAVLSQLFLGTSGGGAIRPPFPVAGEDPSSDDLPPCALR